MPCANVIPVQACPGMSEAGAGIQVPTGNRFPDNIGERHVLDYSPAVLGLNKAGA
jgi:hypothetical protein